uniref:ATP synthase complex subunit 8 n=1 Tax=Ariosoma shiroanago TaxID=135220 RepID=D1YU26_ARISH|nr:ATP synthase F0 subunit 8 [Ariosoma shiroanago]BAI53410.1 ATPase subunit 8 [Ariosoma shiroanago]
MPQLNPAPWFVIMVFSWIVFLTILPTKVLAHHFINNPNPKTTKKPKKEPWNWTWH